MSQVYVLEPPTKGKVVLHTTMGDLDVELWAKETPKAARNFVQLCMEGYYDGTIFHRLIKDFMVQGGDPTGTGEGGSSIYGQPFKDELHTRLKFNHRGLLAYANQNRADSNGSQFFITMDRVDHYNRQYTIFGKVTGDTIYNLSRFNELETDDGDRPVHPPVLTRAEVLWNPFDDLQPRVDRDAKEAAAAAAKEAAATEAKRGGGRKQAKNFSLMSFGEEAEEEDKEAAEAAQRMKIKSAHDALEDERLAKEPAAEIDLDRVREKMRAAKAAQQQQQAQRGDGEQQQQQEEGDFGSRMREQMQAKRRAMGLDQLAAAAAGGQQQQAAAAEEEEQGRQQAAEPGAELDYGESDGEEEGGDDGSDDEGAPRAKRSRLSELQERGGRAAAAVVAPSRQIKVADSELLTDWERKRQEYKQRKRLGGQREKETLSRLARFRQDLQQAAAPPSRAAAAPEQQQQQEASGAAAGAGVEQQQQQQQGDAAAAAAATGGAGAGGDGYSGKVRDDIDHKAYMPAAWRVDDYLAEGGDDEDDAIDLASLRQHRLAFALVKKDAMARSERVDDYVVHDPLLEAGKAKFNKELQKNKKRASEWAGRGRG